MDKNEFRKQAYTKPMIKVIATRQEHLLQIGSGQHGHIGGGGSFGTAKSYAGYDEWEEEEETDQTLGTGSNNSLWEE